MKGTKISGVISPVDGITEVPLIVGWETKTGIVDKESLPLVSDRI